MIPFHIPTPQGCNIQTFYGSATTASSTESRNWKTWNKPVGVSHIYMMLIGSGGDGDGANSGGSGAVTVWYGAAQHVPNVLQVWARGAAVVNSATQVAYLSSTANLVALLSANSSTSAAGGSSMSANYFTASGFFQSTAGQNGVSVGAVSPSATTFLSAGCGPTGGTANYGYTAGGTNGGYFQLQPIIVGLGANQTNAVAVGCGSILNGTAGGQGMVLIASW